MSRGSKARQEGGWTLIELVLVILIIGLLGAIFTPKQMDFQAFKHYYKMTQLKVTLQKIQKTALLMNCELVVKQENKQLIVNAMAPCDYHQIYESVTDKSNVHLSFQADGQIMPMGEGVFTQPASFVVGNLLINQKTGLIDEH